MGVGSLQMRGGVCRRREEFADEGESLPMRGRVCRREGEFDNGAVDLPVTS